MSKVESNRADGLVARMKIPIVPGRYLEIRGLVLQSMEYCSLWENDIVVDMTFGAE